MLKKSLNLVSLRNLYKNTCKNYITKEIQYRSDKTGYYLDPTEVARRFVKLIAMHEDVKEPSKITLNSTFYEIGFNDLSYVDLMFEAENEFYMEFPDEDVEKFLRVNDAVEFIARSFYAK